MHRKCECLCGPLSTPCMFPGFVLSSGHVTYEGAGSDQTPEAAGCSVLVTSRSARGQARCELFLPSPKPSFLSHAKCLMRVPGMGEYWGWKPRLLEKLSMQDESLGSPRSQGLFEQLYSPSG